MVSIMHPFTCFMDVESSRSYIDELYSSDLEKCHDAIVSLKNSVIGSNRQKGSVIAQGVVPRIMQLLSESQVDSLRLEAAVTLCSLAKGSNAHVTSLIDFGCVQLLLNIISTSNQQKLTDTCLSTLRSIYLQPNAPIDLLHERADILELLLRLAGPDNSVTSQACVASLLSTACRNQTEQNVLWRAGTCPVLARLIATPYVNVQIPALSCLTSLVYNNPTIAEAVFHTSHKGVTVPDLLLRIMSRERPVAMQLSAARCVAYLHRGGAMGATDRRVVYGALPCLVRLCAPDNEMEIRSGAADALAYLAEVSTSLQKIAAISNHLIASLADLLNSGEAVGRQSAFRCFASLGANDEDIRKRIIEIDGLMDHMLNGLGDPENNSSASEAVSVRLAAVKCLLSLSRSVQQLRTTFQDHSVWRPLMSVLTGAPSAELLTATTSTLCNLLLEFSPAKEPMLESGVLELLCQLTRREEGPLRLNGIWALMNITFQAEQKMKKRILSTLGMEQIFRLLEDSDTEVIMKTLGLLRNLLSSRTHIDDVMSDYSNDMIRAVVQVLDSTTTVDVTEQALCIVGNICDGDRGKDFIMANEHLLLKLSDYIIHPEPKLQAAALYAVCNLVWRSDLGSEQRQARLRELGVYNLLEQLVTNDSTIFEKVKTAMTQFNDTID